MDDLAVARLLTHLVDVVHEIVHAAGGGHGQLAGFFDYLEKAGRGKIYAVLILMPGDVHVQRHAGDIVFFV